MIPFWIFDFRIWIGRSSSKKILCLPLFALLLTHSFPASAQQAKKVARIGYLSQFEPARESSRAEEIQFALRELGYIEGQNIAIEYRYLEEIDLFSIACLSLRPSWCVSRLISLWQLERTGSSERPRMRPRRFRSLCGPRDRSCRGRPH